MRVNYDTINENITRDDKELYLWQVLQNPYIPVDVEPYYEQSLIILDEISKKTPRNRLVAGGAYSGKSQLVAIDVCRFLMYPEYNALLLRNTYPQITAAGEVVDKLDSWLCDKERLGSYVCKHNHTQHYFEASSGARIWYGSCDNPKQMDKFRGTSYNRIYVIEATEIDEVVLDFMNRSVRPAEGGLNTNIQEMYMLVTNPSYGPGADYIRRNFIDENSPFKYYNLDLMMNDKVDRVKYDQRLSMMSPLQQAFMRYGDWDFIASEGLLLSMEEFRRAEIPSNSYKYSDVNYSVIGIDLAGKGRDNTSLTHLLLMKDGHIIIDDNMLMGTSNIEESLSLFVKRQKQKYNINQVLIEQEGGSSPIYALRHFANILEDLQDEYYFDVDLETVNGKGSKFERATPIAYGIREGMVKVNTNIPNKNQLINQFMYITPVEDKMKELPSPDYLDSCSLAYNFLIEELDIEDDYNYKRGVV